MPLDTPAKPIGAPAWVPDDWWRIAELTGELLATSDLTAAAWLPELSVIAWSHLELGRLDRRHWLACRLRDWCEECRARLERDRDRAERMIRYRVKPLLAAREPKAIIEEAAADANHDVLPWHEIFAILRDEFLHARHQRQRRWV